MGTALEGSPCTSLQSQFNTNKPNFGTIALIVPVSLGLPVTLCPYSASCYASVSTVFVSISLSCFLLSSWSWWTMSLFSCDLQYFCTHSFPSFSGKSHSRYFRKCTGPVLFSGSPTCTPHPLSLSLEWILGRLLGESSFALWPDIYGCPLEAQLPSTGLPVMCIWWLRLRAAVQKVDLLTPQLDKLTLRL